MSAVAAGETFGLGDFAKKKKTLERPSMAGTLLILEAVREPVKFSKTISVIDCPTLALRVFPVPPLKYASAFLPPLPLACLCASRRGDCFAPIGKITIK